MVFQRLSPEHPFEHQPPLPQDEEIQLANALPRASLRPMFIYFLAGKAGLANVGSLSFNIENTLGPALTMPGLSPVEKPLREAEEKTRDYRWLDASAVYEKAFKSNDSNRNPLEAARVSALLARCFVEAAFQAETRTAFKERMVQAKEAYAQAQAFYERSGNDSSSLLSNGKVEFARFWISDDFTERKALIEQVIAIAQEAASTAERKGERESLASAHKDLALYYDRALEFSREFKPLKELVENALVVGEKAVAEYRTLDDPIGLLECMEHLAQLLIFSHNITQPGQPREHSPGRSTRTRDD